MLTFPLTLLGSRIVLEQFYLPFTGSILSLNSFWVGEEKEEELSEERRSTRTGFVPPRILSALFEQRLEFQENVSSSVIYISPTVEFPFQVHFEKVLFFPVRKDSVALFLWVRKEEKRKWKKKERKRIFGSVSWSEIFFSSTFLPSLVLSSGIVEL